MSKQKIKNEPTMIFCEKACIFFFFEIDTRFNCGFGVRARLYKETTSPTTASNFDPERPHSSNGKIDLLVTVKRRSPEASLGGM